MPRITRTELHTYIKSGLLLSLEKDLKEFLLVREADVECAAYMHLRRFLSKDANWIVLARRHVPHTGHYIDLVVFEGDVPRVAIELKWGRSTMGEKDRSSLNAALTKLGVNKAYWISAAVLGNKKNLAEKTEVEKNALFQLFVRANLDDHKKLEWARVRDGFKSKMRKGTGRKCVN